MEEVIDIYDYERQLTAGLRLLRKEKISKRNKSLILKFQQYGILQNLSKPRIIRYLTTLRLLAGYLKKDFDKATKRDIEKLVKIIQERDSSVETKRLFKVMLKRFYKWLKGKDDEYPKQVKWIKCNIKKCDQKLP